MQAKRQAARAFRPEASALDLAECPRVRQSTL
jgi:hypothetical protein